jgi:hypothetical protein
MKNKELEQIKNELNFIARTLSNGYLDFDTIDELCKSIRDAHVALEVHELSLASENTEGELLAA